MALKCWCLTGKILLKIFPWMSWAQSPWRSSVTEEPQPRGILKRRWYQDRYWPLGATSPNVLSWSSQAMGKSFPCRTQARDHYGIPNRTLSCLFILSSALYWQSLSASWRLVLLFSLSIVSDSLWPHRLQNARLPCPSLSPGVCSNSCLLSWWCHPTISSSVAFSSCLQSFSAAGSFPSELVVHIRWPKNRSFSLSISPSNEYSELISLGLTGLNSLLSKGLSRVLSSTTIWSHRLLGAQPSLWFNSHVHTWLLLEKPKLWLYRLLLTKCLHFNMLPRFLIAFLPRSKHLLILLLQYPSVVILEPKKIKSVTASTFSPSICHEVMGPDVMILVFWMLSFKSAFPLSSFTFIESF